MAAEFTSFPEELASGNELHPKYVDTIDPGFLAGYKAGIEAQKNPEVSSAAQGKIKDLHPGQLISPEIEKVIDRLIPVNGGEIILRCYQPLVKDAGPGPYPVHLNFHGGGWCLAGGWTYGEYGRNVDDTWLRFLCHEAHCAAIDVDYRLAPKFKHPVQFEDCFTALKFVIKHAMELNVDPLCVSIGGASAGGHLAAAVAHAARDAGIQLVMQLLVVAATDLRVFDSATGKLKEDCPYKSWREHQFAPMVPLAAAEWSVNQLLGTDNPKRRATTAEHWSCSPMAATDFSGLAPAAVFVAEFDICSDDILAYAGKLREHDVPCQIILYECLPHSFIYMSEYCKQARDFIYDSTGALAIAYAQNSS